MVAVGDSNQVFLFDISVAAGYQKIGTYTGNVLTRDGSCPMLELCWIVKLKRIEFYSNNGRQLFVRLESILR